MARVCGEDLSDDKYNGTLHRIVHVLHKLIDCSAELGDIEKIAMELKTEAHGSPNDMEASVSSKERPNLLLVAGTLREMVNALMLGLEGVPEIQKVRNCVSAEDHVSKELLHNGKRKRPSPVEDRATQTEASKVCNPSTAKIAAVKGPGVCRHTCIHHAEVVDRWLWRQLPEHLVELIFARLPMPQIIDLVSCSEAWSAMSRTSGFKRACAEAHPKLFGLLGWNLEYTAVRTTIYDSVTNEWLPIELTSFPCKDAEYKDSMYACDGGLVCFVPRDVEPSLSPILVCNPLTNDRKTLPIIPLAEKQLILVQLVVDADTQCYRVILVCRRYDGDDLVADFYDSQTGSWSIMDCGLVYGTSREMVDSSGSPLVFDCSTNSLLDLEDCPSVQDLKRIHRWSLFKGRLVVVHETEPHEYGISEYVFDSNAQDVKRLKIHGIPSASVPTGFDVVLFSNSDFILSIWDNAEFEENHHQFIKLYDLSADIVRLDLPLLVKDDEILMQEFQSLFMCQLRWDAIP